MRTVVRNTQELMPPSGQGIRLAERPGQRRRGDYPWERWQAGGYFIGNGTSTAQSLKAHFAAHDRVIVLTPSPTRVQEIVDIPLPRPRDQVVTKEIPEFAHLRGYVWRSIKRPETTDVPA